MSVDDDDNLICPITQEYFRDPVIAEDGRLYEREAITRWINEHGTSPFTRQVLNVNHLQTDDEVKKRADQRKRLSVSYNRETNQIQLPPIRTSRNMRFTNRVNDIGNSPQPIHQSTGRLGLDRQNNQNTCCEARGSGRSSCRWKIIAYLCVIATVVTPFVVAMTYMGLSQPSRTSFSRIRYTTRPPLCNAWISSL